MEAGAVAVLGVLGGALLYRSARERLSVHWLIAIVVVGALSGLLLGRSAALAPGVHTDLIQRASIATVFAAWWLLIREVVRDGRAVRGASATSRRGRSSGRRDRRRA
ncbi:MAG TPA: hypothetical protein VKV69_14770 [Actinomycetota bacterium]|nr:hypothetical protein [Actinomycetota bacterium]